MLLKHVGFYKKWQHELMLHFFSTGHDPIGAKVFAVCADKTPLVKCFNACDAVTCLFELCFVLDLEYPNLKSTIEFFER